jgi:hypothetical protein
MEWGSKDGCFNSVSFRTISFERNPASNQIIESAPVLLESINSSFFGKMFAFRQLSCINVCLYLRFWRAIVTGVW